jgi:hypothetical protein
METLLATASSKTLHGDHTEYIIASYDENLQYCRYVNGNLKGDWKVINLPDEVNLIDISTISASAVDGNVQLVIVVEDKSMYRWNMYNWTQLI